MTKMISVDGADPRPMTDAELAQDFSDADRLEITKDAVRYLRDQKLKSEVDPIVSNPLRWADMTTAEQNAWSQYRTDLLNITDQAGFPHNVTWPTKP